MEQIATRLEQLLPAVRRRAGDEIALSAVNLKEFSGSVEPFHVASGDDTIEGWSRHVGDSWLR